MKMMTCRQLGGACDAEFRAETFEEIAQLSQDHGMEMLKKGDPAHLAAMDRMKELMQSPEAMQKWLALRRREFEGSPDVS